MGVRWLDVTVQDIDAVGLYINGICIGAVKEKDHIDLIKSNLKHKNSGLRQGESMEQKVKDMPWPKCFDVDENAGYGNGW